MTISKLVLAAAALALSSGAAFAASSDRHARKPLMSVSMDREVGQQRTTVFGLPASEPTIFGHPVARSIYVVPGDHEFDRTR